jgi:hypothetical protein
VEAGFFLEWHFEQCVVVFRMEDTRRETIDAWEKSLLEVARAWPTEKPYQAMYHVATEGVTSTPYARQRIQERSARFFDEFPHLQGQIAVLLPDSFTGQVMRFVMQTIVRARIPGFEYRAFTDRDKALAWLGNGC